MLSREMIRVKGYLVGLGHLVQEQQVLEGSLPDLRYAKAVWPAATAIVLH